jgi:hypothetical protein
LYEGFFFGGLVFTIVCFVFLSVHVKLATKTKKHVVKLTGSRIHRHHQFVFIAAAAAAAARIKF